ncbi:MAG: hypothetical protein ACJAVV_000862 [Alphaproteobacteria bacterium]|jgi:hypothetical protein
MISSRQFKNQAEFIEGSRMIAHFIFIRENSASIKLWPVK